MEAKEYLEQEQRISELLEPGERVSWRGKPDRKLFNAQQITGMVIGAIVLIYFGNMLVTTFLDMSRSPGDFEDKGIYFMGIGGLVFLIGLAISLSLRGLLKQSERWKGVEYLATDRRLIILDSFPEQNSTSFAYKDITEIRLEPAGASGRAGLSNIRVAGKKSIPDKAKGEVPVDDFTFLGIEQAGEVMRLINEAREKRRQVLQEEGEVWR
jgi:hypothetical protein